MADLERMLLIALRDPAATLVENSFHDSTALVAEFADAGLVLGWLRARAEPDWWDMLAVGAAIERSARRLIAANRQMIRWIDEEDERGELAAEDDDRARQREEIALAEAVLAALTEAEKAVSA
ncbi:hypothetical protein [Miltoncostaea marina]|uniref:hypothetical protein n=1 Tax=Miltoncostaea marina TaxID=2843215 RepID=UPI001C3C7AF4|nr:hypothetical protein [Miltoncostaea marina]